MASISQDSVVVPGGVVVAYCGRYAAAAPPPPPPVAPGQYRNSQPLLFSDVAASTPVAMSTDGNGTLARVPARASVADPKQAYNLGIHGVSHFFVDHYAQWSWVRPGGDWIDRTGTAQATAQPHFSFAANTVTTGAASYTVDVTDAFNAAHAGNRWAAFIVRKTGAGQRTFASRHNPTMPGPTVAITYTNGATATLAATCCTSLVTGTAYAQTGRPETNVPCALEFPRPTGAVASAVMTVWVAQHNISPATIEGFLANPNTAALSPVTQGIAAGYPGDEGIINAPGVQFAQQYKDGGVLTDFVLPPTGVDYFSSAAWSPAMIGGADDAAKLPTAAGGMALKNKWMQKQITSNVTLVPSTHTGDGFVAHTPGYGALRVVIPSMTVGDGGAMGPLGSTGCDLVALFDQAIAGTEAARTVNVRYKLWVATPPKALADMLMIRENGGSAIYAAQGGKMGIGPQHWTAEGGNNLNGGLGYGHTARITFHSQPADIQPGGIVLRTHSQDMDPANADLPWGGTNGLAACIYPGRWVEIEEETTLNTFNPAGGSPFDGVQRIYIDGKLAVVNSGWQWRDGPLSTTTQAGRQPPVRTLGFLGLLMNFYQGGRLAADGDFVAYVSAVVGTVGGVYIGPMAAPAVAVGGPAWGGQVTALNTWTKITAAAPGGAPEFRAWAIANTPDAASFKGSDPFGAVITSNGGPAYDSVGKIVYQWGGGHAAGSVNAVYRTDLDKLHLQPYSIVVPATPPAKYPPAYAANILGGVVYPSGAHDDANFPYSTTHATFLSTLTDPLDVAYNLSANAPMATHPYQAVNFQRINGVAKLAIDYFAVSQANLETGVWDLASTQRHATRLEQLGLARFNLQQGCKVHFDEETQQRFATVTPGDAAISSRNHIARIDALTNLITAVHPIPQWYVSNGASICAVGRKLWIFPNLYNGANGVNATTANQAMTFDMDTYVVQYFNIVGSSIVVDVLTANANPSPQSQQESVPCIGIGGGVIARWNHSVADQNKMYMLDTSPTGGAGTHTNPFVLNQAVRQLSGMTTRPTFQYRLIYVDDWQMFVVHHGPTSGWYALKLS